MKIYLANALFGQADRDFNDKVAKIIRDNIPGVDLYVPQENMGINDKNKTVTSQDITNADMDKLLQCDVLFAIIDGAEIDSGVAAEIGSFYTLGVLKELNKPIYALCTDIRFNNNDMSGKVELIQNDVFENPIKYTNLFVTGQIKLSGGYITDDIYKIINDIKE